MQFLIPNVFSIAVLGSSNRGRNVFFNQRDMVLATRRERVERRIKRRNPPSG